MITQKLTADKIKYTADNPEEFKLFAERIKNNVSMQPFLSIMYFDYKSNTLFINVDSCSGREAIWLIETTEGECISNYIDQLESRIEAGKTDGLEKHILDVLLIVQFVAIICFSLGKTLESFDYSIISLCLYNISAFVILLPSAYLVTNWIFKRFNKKRK